MKKYFTILVTLCFCVTIQRTMAQYWNTTGNAGLTGSNFLGTTDGAALNIKVNNQKSGVIEYLSTGNTAWGYQAMRLNTGTGNSGFGYQSLYSNTSGSYNTGGGSFALFSNNTGANNCAYGRRALQFNTTGSDNVALGYSAMYYNNTSSSNTAVGSYSMFYNTGYGNVGVGTYALYKNNTGVHNTAVGDSAFYSGTGTGNTVMGAYTLLYATACNYNTVAGFASMFFNTTGSSNAAVGRASLGSNTTGSYNSAFGEYALTSNATGSYNTAVGSQSGPIGSYTNTSALGYNASVDANNKIRIGNSSVTSIGGQVGWSVFSDGRIKKDINENVPGLAFIKALRPVTYNYVVQKQNDLLGITADTAQWEEKNEIEKIKFTGLIAQEVDAAAKKINYNFSGVDKSGKIMSLRYSDFVPPLIKAVQELSTANDELKNKNEALEKRIARLESLLNMQQPADASSMSQTANTAGAQLSQNYPNPFSSETTIQVKIPQPYKSAQLIITDKSGNAVKTIAVNNGSSSITINASSFLSGVYQYTLYVNGKLECTKQMVIAR